MYVHEKMASGDVIRHHKSNAAYYRGTASIQASPGVDGAMIHYQTDAVTPPVVLAVGAGIALLVALLSRSREAQRPR